MTPEPPVLNPDATAPENRAPPGVYTLELTGSELPAPAVTCPAFVGYTQFARDGVRSVHEKPMLVRSMEAYHQFFGKAPVVSFALLPDSAISPTATAADGCAASPVQVSPRFRLYTGVALFFANGGGSCYVVSVGDFGGPLQKEPLLRGIAALMGELEPTEIAAPDAVALSVPDCLEVQNAMLEHCAAHGRRFALLDVPGGDRPNADARWAGVEAFRQGLTSRALEFGAAYYPWLNCTNVDNLALDLRNFADGAALAKLLEAGIPAEFNPDRRHFCTSEIRRVPEVLAAADDSKLRDLHEALRAISPRYEQLLREMTAFCQLQPPSGAMAGVFASVDAAGGVWRAPANVDFAAVASPLGALSQQEEQDLLSPPGGKPINAIRAIPGRGVVVWGARTLAQNHTDFEYIATRRTANRIGQDAATSLSCRVFQPSTPETWREVHGEMARLLLQFWKNGALAGATAEEAFGVAVGLGETMTAQDVLDGVLRVDLRVALVRPGDFLAITLEQQQAADH